MSTSSSSWVDERAQYAALAASVTGAAVLGTKDTWGWRTLYWSGVVLSCGVLWLLIDYRSWSRAFAGAFGPWIGIPREIARVNRRLLMHELRHVRQCEFLGWLIPVFGWFFGSKARALVGMIPFSIIYFLPFPLFLAYGRYRLELGAEAAAWRDGLASRTLRAGDVWRLADTQGRLVGSRTYGWAWPTAVDGYRRRAAAEISRYLKDLMDRGEVVSNDFV